MGRYVERVSRIKTNARQLVHKYVQFTFIHTVENRAEEFKRDWPLLRPGNYDLDLIATLLIG